MHGGTSIGALCVEPHELDEGAYKARFSSAVNEGGPEKLRDDSTSMLSPSWTIFFFRWRLIIVRSRPRWQDVNQLMTVAANVASRCDWRQEESTISFSSDWLDSRRKKKKKHAQVVMGDWFQENLGSFFIKDRYWL